MSVQALFRQKTKDMAYEEKVKRFGHGSDLWASGNLVLSKIDEQAILAWLGLPELGRTYTIEEAQAMCGDEWAIRVPPTDTGTGHRYWACASKKDRVPDLTADWCESESEATTIILHAVAAARVLEAGRVEEELHHDD